MKTLLKLFLGVLALSLTMAGCKKDDEPVNLMEAGDVSCILTDGNILYVGTGTYNSTPYYSYTLQLASQGLTLSTDGSGYPEYEGSGVFVIVSIYSTGTPRPDNGDDYVYHEWSANTHALNYGYYSLNYVTTKASSMDFASGTVTVSNKGSDNYTIKYEGTGEDGIDIKFEYTGKLKYYDASSWVKK